MAQTEGQRQAAEAVSSAMSERGMTNADLSAATGDLEDASTPVDVGTIGDFLKGSRWPRAVTLGRFERVFGWEVGSLARYARGGEPPGPAAKRLRSTAVGVDRLADVDDHDLLAEVARRMARARTERKRAHAELLVQKNGGDPLGGPVIDLDLSEPSRNATE